MKLQPAGVALAANTLGACQTAHDWPSLGIRSGDQGGHALNAGLGATLHEAAASAGLTIPKACGMGICGTCKVRVVAGETAMAHNGGISEEEITDGYVLSCCTRVKGNVEVAY